MSEEEEERLKRQKGLRQVRKQAVPPPTSEKPIYEVPLDLKTKQPNPENVNTFNKKHIRILEDKIIHKVPLAYVPPNVYIENNYYEPITPPESSNNTDSVETNTSDTEETTTVPEEMTQQIEEYHVVTHDQYLEYLTLKKHFKNNQDETTEVTQDAAESENENNNTQNNIRSAREKKIQELIGISDEYKNYFLSILNKVKTSDISRNIMTVSLLAKLRMIHRQKSLELIQEMGWQRVNSAMATNPIQEDVHIVNEGINTIPAHITNEASNVGNEWQSRMMTADHDATNLSNVQYVNHAPRKDFLQNEQENVQTKANYRFTVIPNGQQQFLPHTYSQQQIINPNTFVPRTPIFPEPMTQSNRPQVYFNPDTPNFHPQRWNNPVYSVDKPQTYLPKVFSSCEIQTYPDNEKNPLILIRQQKVPKSVISNEQQHVEQNIPGGSIKYPERVVINNQQPTFSDPVELSSQYPEPAAAVPYQSQSYNESTIPTIQQQNYPENKKYSEQVSRKSRQQRLSQDQLIPGQHPYSEGITPNVEQIRYSDPYVLRSKQQMYSEQNEYSTQQRYSGIPSESPERYQNPVIPSNQHARYYNQTVLDGQQYIHPISPAYAQQQTYLEQTAPSTKQKTQPKRQYQRRKDTLKKQHPAPLRWQQTHTSPPTQPHPMPQVLPRMPLRMPPQVIPPNATLHSIPEAVPQYYPQYYNEQHENPHVYRDVNYQHPYNNP